MGFGGYEAYTWACEYPDEMEFLIIGYSSFKTNGYRYITSKAINNIIESSDAYLDTLYSDYLVANNCSLPFRIEYFAISASVSEHNTIPIVGLSSLDFFSSSYILTYISIWPTS